MKHTPFSQTSHEYFVVALVFASTCSRRSRRSARRRPGPGRLRAAPRARRQRHAHDAPPRAGPPARRVGPATRRAAPVRGGAGAAGRRPGQVVGARRHALDAPARGAERVPRVRPGATLRRAAALPLPHPRGSRSPLKLKRRRRLLFLIYALLATTTMLSSKVRPDLRAGVALCRASCYRGARPPRSSLGAGGQRRGPRGGPLRCVVAGRVLLLTGERL